MIRVEYEDSPSGWWQRRIYHFGPFAFFGGWTCAYQY